MIIGALPEHVISDDLPNLALSVQSLHNAEPVSVRSSGALVPPGDGRSSRTTV